MAGDWIKMRTDLYRDPKVCVIADELMAADGELAGYVSQMKQRDMTVTRNVTRNATVGSLVTVWGVMRHRGKRVERDLLCRGVTLSIIDDVSDMPGFGAAMSVVGWAVETDDGVVFPNFFDDYNVDPAEKKSLAAAERQRRYRESKKQKEDVTRDVTRDVTVTHREEKRREEEYKDASAPVPLPTRGKKPKATTLPDGFGISERVQRWAEEKGHNRLAQRLEHFTSYAKRSGKQYADWDEAFMAAIREDWAKLSNHPQQGAAPQSVVREWAV